MWASCKCTWSEDFFNFCCLLLVALSSRFTYFLAFLCVRLSHPSYALVVFNDQVMLHSSQSSRKLKLKVPLLDGTLLTFETRCKIMHVAIQEFEGRGMPLSGGRGHGKLFVQFQFTDKAQQQAPPRSSSRQRSSRHFESRYGGGGGGPFWE